MTKTDMPPTEVEAPLGQLTFFQKLAKKDVYWHLAFGGLLLGSAIWFIFWAFDYVGETDQALLLVITIAFAVFMAFNIGGNDVANLSLIHISEPTRREWLSRMPSSA